MNKLSKVFLGIIIILIIILVIMTYKLNYLKKSSLISAQYSHDVLEAIENAGYVIQTLENGTVIMTEQTN